MAKFLTKTRLAFLHVLGASCLGTTAFVSLSVFWKILSGGYCLVFEANPLILFSEFFASVGALVYTSYLYISSLKRFLVNARA